jgi:hypothetical protein
MTFAQLRVRHLVHQTRSASRSFSRQVPARTRARDAPFCGLESIDGNRAGIDSGVVELLQAFVEGTGRYPSHATACPAPYATTERRDLSGPAFSISFRKLVNARFWPLRNRIAVSWTLAGDLSHQQSERSRAH